MNPNDPFRNQNPSPIVPPPAPQPVAVPPSYQTPENKAPFYAKGASSAYKKLPLKIILFIFLGLTILLGGFAILKNTVLKPKPQPVTITWWGLWEDDAAIKPIIADFEAKNPLIKVTYVKQSPKDYRERLTSALAKVTGAPDVFRFHNTWVPMLSREFAALPAEIMSQADYSSRFYPVAAHDLTSGGRIVGVPLMIDGLGLYINEDIFTNAGTPVPTNWDDLRKAALALTIRNEDETIAQAGVALGTIKNVDHWQDILALMMLQNGADLTKPSDKRAQDALSFYTIFADSDKVWDDTLPSSTAAFAAGKAAMYFGPSWRVFDIKKQNPNLNFRIVPVPQLPKATETEKDINWASYWAEGVWARSVNSKQAFEFLKYLTEKENLQKLYTNEAATRVFGEPYSRADMASLVTSDSFAGAYVRQAPNMQSWYLASNTNDGPTGINSRISKYFEDAVNKVLVEGDDPESALETVEQGVNQVLSSYAQ
ncbi:extracellular solute-binding protein [Candidatus Microgenomates bacterium]|nr:extracellular solute-binding protein [Candidatus Microgenomates bacterium]